VSELLPYQLVLIGVLFIWSGFVRSGLGFGGAVLALPFLLLVLDQPLVFLPIIGIHLLLFSALTVYQNHRKLGTGEGGTVDWAFLRYALLIMAVPKIIGVFGVITLPGELISGFVFVIVSIYAVSYILDRPFKSNNRWLDHFFMMLGGYVSGTSLIAAPLVVPVAANRVRKEQLRDTLFALWFILVSVKLGAFIVAGVNLQLIHQLWLLPCAALGHVIGLRFHAYTLRAEPRVFFRVIGSGLLLVSLVGLWRLLQP